MQRKCRGARARAIPKSAPSWIKKIRVIIVCVVLQFAVSLVVLALIQLGHGISLLVAVGSRDDTVQAELTDRIKKFVVIYESDDDARKLMDALQKQVSLQKNRTYRM